MEPSELFDVCMYRWFRKLAQLVGIDVFTSKFKPNILTYTTISSLFLFLVSCTWTIYSYDFDEKIISCSVLAFNCQGIIKFFSILTKTETVKDICNFCSKIYRANRNSGPNKVLLSKSVKLTIFFFKNGMTLLITTAALVLLKPCISYFAFGILDPILPTHFPGIDEDQIVGYTTLAVFHTYIAFIFVVGTAGCDLLLLTLAIHSYSMADIYQNAVTEFNVIIGNLNASKEGSRSVLRNLILMHIDFIRYTRTVKTIYNEMCLIQITMANTIMIVLLYVILMMDWFPAYFLMAVAFFQVFEYSLMGTVIQISNNNVYNAICNILITDLPMDEQKKVAFMTLLAQHPHNLTIGGFSMLNVETFLYSMKNTYSVGMLLVNTRLQ